MMNLDFTENIPSNFDDRSRVWIYQSSHSFSKVESLDLENSLNEFVSQWKTHGATVKGFAILLFDQFIVLMADETAEGVSGCSTDSSVRLIKAIEEKYKVQMFDRHSMAFVVKDKIQLLPINQLAYAVENNFINADTFYFNNTVLTKKDLLSNWIIPIKESWLAKRIQFSEEI